MLVRIGVQAGFEPATSKQKSCVPTVLWSLLWRWSDDDDYYCGGDDVQHNGPGL